MRRVGAVVLMLTLVACTAPGDGDGDRSEERAAVQQAGEQVAAAIAGDSLAEVDWAEQDGAAVAEEYDEVVAGLGDTEPTVAVTGAVSTATEGTATLSWTWPIGGGDEPWEYQSSVRVVRAEDADTWRPVWQRAVVEPSLGEQGELLVRTVEVDRGDITGAGGAVIVTDRPVERIGIDKTLVGPQRAVRDARELARLLDVDPGPYANQVDAAGDKAFVEAITLREGDLTRAVQRGVNQIKGARAIGATLPLAPTREFAAPILGRVGPVTAEMVADHPDRYRAGDVAGVSGLQARYDAQLGGNAGVRVIAFDPGGDERELFAIEAGEGEDLALTLDPALQRTAEDLLGGTGPAAALVALRPSDGSILAAANARTGGLNHATFGQFAPGSTFKIASSLALLRSGLTPDSPVECAATADVDGRDFENYDGYPAAFLGTIGLRTAVAQSCNTAFISQYDELDDGALADAAASLGLGVDHDLGFPAYFGQVPAPASETEAAAALIGQGKVLASPMTMAAVIASVQSGEVVVPRLVEQVEVSAPDVAPLTDQEAEQLRAMLRQAVTDGSAGNLADVPGEVIAKTGTAEYETEDGLRTHAWMVAARGDLAVAVFVETGDSGSGTAGPILEQFLRAAAD